MLIKILAASFLAMTLITCKTTRHRSSLKVDQNPVDFDDSTCYGTFDPTVGGSAPEAQQAIAGLCPNEKLALQKYFDFQDSTLMIIFRDYKKDIDGLFAQAQMEQYSLNGRETPATASQTMQTLLTRVRKRNATYAQVLNYFASPLDRASNNKLKSQLDVYKANKCIFTEDPGLDTAFAYEFCQLSLLTDKLQDMAKTRATVPLELLTINSRDTPVIYSSIAKELTNLGKEIAETILTHKAIVDSGDLSKLGAAAVPYPALALEPNFLEERMTLAFKDLEDAATRYSNTTIETYNLSLQQIDIKDKMTNLVSGRNDSKVQFDNMEQEKKRLAAERDKKQLEKTMIAAENTKAGERLSKEASDYISVSENSTYIQPLKVKVDGSEFGTDVGLLVADNFNSLPQQIIPFAENNLLNLNPETRLPEYNKDLIVTLVLNGEVVPSIVANGVYSGIQTRLKVNSDWLLTQKHQKYTSDGWGRSSKKCVVHVNGDPLDHSYVCDPTGITQRVRDATVFLRDKMLNGDMNVYRQYTAGLDGYIQSRSWNQGTSKSPPPAAPNWGAQGLSLIGTAVGTYFGGPIGGAAGGLLGEMAGYRKGEAGTSSSSGIGISFSAGYYHALAKYPDIRVGQLVAELGCNGKYNEYIPPQTQLIEGSDYESRKTGVQILTGKVLEIISFPFDSGVLTKAADIKAPLEGFSGVDFRFPAGNVSVVVMKVPKECKNPSARLILNDAPLGVGTKNCLKGDEASNTDPAAEWTKPLANNDPRTDCSYFSASLRIRVSAALLKSDDVNKALTKLNRLGITDSTKKVEKLDTIAYNPDAWQAAEAYVSQFLKKDPAFKEAGDDPTQVTDEGITKVMPLVRAYVSRRINDRNITDLEQQISDLNNRITQQDNLLSQSQIKANLYTKVIQSANDQALIQGVYKSTLEDQKAVHFNQFLNSLERTATWTSIYLASLEYNQYQKTNLSEKRRNILNVIDDLRRHAIGLVNKDEVLIDEVNEVLNNSNAETQAKGLKASWPAYITSRLARIRQEMVSQAELAATRNKLITNRTGHCHVSMAAIYPQNFVILDSENFNSDADLTREPQKNKDGLVYANGYRLLLDMTKLPDWLKSSDINIRNQINCTHTLETLTATFPPKILGIGIEMRGKGTALVSLTGKQKVSVKRSNVMSWPVRDASSTSETPAYRQLTRFVDYSQMQNIEPFSSINLPLSEAVPIQVSKNLDQCSPGYTRATSNNLCISQMLGANLASGFGVGPNFPFNPTELNVFLGSQFEILFLGESATGFREANNVIMHFFYYIPFPVVQ